MYSVFYDSSLSTYGNVLMFEYKLTTFALDDKPNPDNISTLGYVAIENAVNAGISNQWNVAIPALDSNTYDSTATQSIRIRVYVGSLTTSQVGVTEWSNELEVHNPPQAPVLLTAFYDTPSIGNRDDLYVVIDDSSMNYYNTNPGNGYTFDTDIQFIAAFYYKNGSHQPVWDVSIPVDALPLGNTGKLLIHVSDFGDVSDNSSNDVVYTAVYAVYKFTDNSNNYYSVSHISTTINAEPAAFYTAPTNVTIDYLVYTDPSHADQIMNVSWTAPNVSILPYPTYSVDHYRVYYRAVENPEATWLYLDTSNNITEIDIDVVNFDEHATIEFKVAAISTNGTFSADSIIATKNIFYYSDAPENLTFVGSDASDNMIITFDNPQDMGSGTPNRFVITADVGIMNVDYDPSGNYSVAFPTAGIAFYGTIEVLLETRDTNSNNYLAGATASTPYLLVDLNMSDVDYDIYVNNTQNMYLEWAFENLSLNGTNWSISGYDLQWRKTNNLNVGNWTSFISGATITDACFNALTNGTGTCGDFFEFRVITTFIHTSPSTFLLVGPVVSQNFFRKSGPIRNLSITNFPTYNSTTGIVSIEIPFTAPLDPGCGDDLQYLITIGGVTATISDASFNGTYTYNVTIPATQEGEVSVTPQTIDTNGGGYINGPESTINYFALPPLSVSINSYDVYSSNGSNIGISWTDLVYGSTTWTATYDVFYQVRDESNNIDLSWNQIENDILLRNTILNLSNTSFNTCGYVFEFRVDASVTNGTLTFTDDAESTTINVFHKSEAPTGGAVVNDSSSYSNGHAIMNITFSNPSNNNTGCGVPTSFYILVNDIPQQGSVTYVENAQSYNYSINASSAPQSGIIKVYLVTTDNNGGLYNGNGGTQIRGSSLQFPYFAVDTSLDTIVPADYDVYSDPNKVSQDIHLSWNAQTGSGWLASYQVQYNVDAGLWVNAIGTQTGTSFVFNTTTNGITADPQTMKTISFRVVTTMSYGSVVHVDTSDSSSINYFSFASQPQTLVVQWAAADASLNTMDVHATFENPITPGCGTILIFIAELLDASGNSVGVNPLEITYNASTSSYEANFDEVYYMSSGKVRVCLQTTDTNSQNTMNGVYSVADFTSVSLPLFRNVDISESNTLLTFEVVSNALLKPNGKFMYKTADIGSALVKTNWNTLAIMSDYLKVDISRGYNNEYKYTISVYSQLFGLSSFPSVSGISVSNDAGIETEILLLPLDYV